MKFNFGKFKFPNINIPKKLPACSKPVIIRPNVKPINIPVPCTTIPIPPVPESAKSEVRDGMKRIGTVMATAVAAETMSTAEEAVGKYVNNYRTRRNVGFDPIESLKGSYHDTVKFYGDRLAGRPAKDPIQAVYFDD